MLHTHNIIIVTNSTIILLCYIINDTNNIRIVCVKMVLKASKFGLYCVPTCTACYTVIRAYTGGRGKGGGRELH